MTIANKNVNPVVHMVEQLDAADAEKNLGYVTNSSEVIEILKNLSPLIPVVILKEENETNGEISVMMKIGFTLERKLL